MRHLFSKCKSYNNLRNKSDTTVRVSPTEIRTYKAKTRSNLKPRSSTGTTTEPLPSASTGSYSA